MTLAAEAPVITPAPLTPPPAARVQRQVAVLVDACCEISPDEAMALGIEVLPREAKVDNRAALLDIEKTLHPSCWPTPLRSVAPGPLAVGDLAQRYGDVLRQGQSVLVIQPASQYDPAGRAALAARSVLMADGAFAHSTARVAVYEPAALGAGYTYLVLAAARAAANGLGLAQVVTLLDQLQVEVRALYVTGSRGPIERVRLRQPNGFQLGGQQLWQIDRASGMLGRLAGSWSVIKALTAPESPLSTRQPDCVSFSDGRLLQALNRELGKAGQLGLAASQAGVGLNSTFPSGCVELTWLPEQAHVAGIIAIIERINRPAHVSRGGIRQRGGL